MNGKTITILMVVMVALVGATVVLGGFTGIMNDVFSPGLSNINQSGCDYQIQQYEQSGNAEGLSSRCIEQSDLSEDVKEELK